MLLVLPTCPLPSPGPMVGQQFSMADRAVQWESMLWVGPKMLTCPAPDQRLAAFLGRWNSPVRRVAACCWLSAGGAHDAGRRISSANPGRQAQVNYAVPVPTDWKNLFFTEVFCRDVMCMGRDSSYPDQKYFAESGLKIYNFTKMCF